jgi:hypothetical protein
MKYTYVWTVVAVVGMSAIAGRWDSPVPRQVQDARTIQAGLARSRPFTVDLTVDGPAQVACGASARYVAMLRFSDGSTRDVTASADWTASDDGMLTARFAGHSAARSVNCVR